MVSSNPQKKRVTIKSVADTAGVSTQTVSRVINNRPDVAPETRQRVKDVIEELGYRPSAVARSLIQQRSYTLGVVSAGLKNYGPSQILHGITQKAEEMGYALLLKESCRDDYDDCQEVIQSLLSRHVDGIIWGIPETENNRTWLSEDILKLAVPVVFSGISPIEGASVITIDNYNGGKLAARHLLSQGYQVIGHISGPMEYWDALSRKHGWEDALTDAGIQVNNTYWAAGDWSAASGEHAMVHLLEQLPSMEAVFVANDQMALGALKVLHKRAFRIPGDMAVVGFDGIPESAYFHPSLTTVYQDLHELGCKAVEALVGIIEKRRQGFEGVDARTVILQPELIQRESTLTSQPSLLEKSDTERR